MKTHNKNQIDVNNESEQIRMYYVIPRKRNVYLVGAIH